MVDYTDEFYQVIRTSSKDKLNRFCDNYPGFEHYAKALNDIGQVCSEGKLDAFLTLSEEEIQKTPLTSRFNTDRKYLIELQKIMKQALLQMHTIVIDSAKNKTELIPNISVFYSQSFQPLLI